MSKSLLRGALCAALSWVALAQVAILQIRVVEGEGGVHAAGSRMARPLLVEVTDETGRPVAGATLSFHLPEDGPGGTFANGLRTEVAVTDGNGRASLRGVTLNRQPGRFTVRIIAVKEQARAGIFSQQYIAEPKGGARSARAGNRKHGKWIAIGLVTGATAAGILAGVVRSGHSPAAVPAPPPVVPTAPPPVIGVPVITVGKP